MQEDFIHYLWKHKKFEVIKLKASSGKGVSIISVGQHNVNSGPDFFNAKIKIGKQLWAGNVEIHIKSSDWFLHNHEQDRAYDNVILHVVWEHDTDVFRKNNTPVETLVLKDYANISILNNYNKLFSAPEVMGSNTWINCENDFKDVEDFVLNNWLERLYFERLEHKSKTIETLLETSKNDWEAVLFKMLAKNFGLKVNGASFFSVAQSIDFKVIRKIHQNQYALEAMLFGQAGLLDSDIENGYYSSLKSEYEFLIRKFKLRNTQIIAPQFFRLRPSNFPTIRWSQLACLYQKHQNLFSKIIHTEDLNAFYVLFKVTASEFWNTHYTFQKTSKPSVKAVSKSFIDLLLINTILPIKFLYEKQQNNDLDTTILKIATSISSEKNNIISAFNSLKKVSESAMDSQALIQLKTSYCEKNKCLQCGIGNALMLK